MEVGREVRDIMWQRGYDVYIATRESQMGIRRHAGSRHSDWIEVKDWRDAKSLADELEVVWIQGLIAGDE